MTYEASTFLYAIAVAIFALGGMVGGFTGGWIANKCGRFVLRRIPPTYNPLQFLFSVQSSCKVYREQIIFHEIYKNLLNYTLANHTLLNHTPLNGNQLKQKAVICLTILC